MKKENKNMGINKICKCAFDKIVDMYLKFCRICIYSKTQIKQTYGYKEFKSITNFNFCPNN